MYAVGLKDHDDPAATRGQMRLELQDVWSWVDRWELGHKESVSPIKVSGPFKNYTGAYIGGEMEGNETDIIYDAESFERNCDPPRSLSCPPYLIRFPLPPYCFILSTYT